MYTKYVDTISRDYYKRIDHRTFIWKLYKMKINKLEIKKILNYRFNKENTYADD
jgi:hypothetical protein